MFHLSSRDMRFTTGVSHVTQFFESNKTVLLMCIICIYVKLNKRSV